jgi:hypothetical protein
MCRTEGVKVEVAFKRAVDRAKYDHGHAGYTGTIAEKSAFVVIPCRGTDESKVSQARGLLDKMDPRVDDKWGPAGAIKLKRGWLFFGWASC